MHDMTIEEVYYHNVVVEGGPISVADTAEEAVAYARRHVYLAWERVPDMEALLRSGQVAEWQYGFKGVSIVPVRRRRIVPEVAS